MDNKEQIIRDKLDNQGLRDEDRAALQNELKRLMEEEAKRAEAIEEKVQADDIPYAESGADLSGLPPEVFALIQKVVRADRKKMLNVHAIELELKEKEIEDLITANGSVANAYDDLRKAHDELAQAHQILANTHEDIVKDLKFELKHANAQRDTAVQKYEDAELDIGRLQSEIARLNGVIEEYERNAEYAERQDQPITVGDEDAEDIRTAIEAVQKLYVKSENWGSVEKLTLPDGTFAVVPRKEMEDWVEVQEASEAPESTFREQAIVEQPPLYAALHSGDEEVAGNETQGELVPEEPVTRAEFEELKGRVDILFRNQDIGSMAKGVA